MQRQPLRSIFLPILLACFAAGVASAACTAETQEPMGWQPSDQVCRESELRVYTARLVRVPWWQDWQSACAQTSGAPVEGVARIPDRCVRRTPFGIWGEWDVRDDACRTAANPSVSAQGPQTREGEHR